MLLETLLAMLNLLEMLPVTHNRARLPLAMPSKVRLLPATPPVQAPTQPFSRAQLLPPLLQVLPPVTPS
jgi:hypothetical protein